MTTSRVSKLFPSAGILAVALGGLGCAGASASARPAMFDVRGSAQVADAEPRMLVEGPVRLLHVDVDGRRDVTFFRVPRRPGSEIDCRQGAVAIDARGVARTGTSRLDLDVAANEGVCFAAGSQAGGSRKVRVSWHARGQKAGTTEPGVQMARLP